MGAFFVGPLIRTARSCPLPLQPLRQWVAEKLGLDDECLTPLDRMTRMKSFSQHEIDLRWMSGGRRIRIVGTSPTIMLSINDVFQGWFANPKGACDALDPLAALDLKSLTFRRLSVVMNLKTFYHHVCNLVRQQS